MTSTNTTPNIGKQLEVTVNDLKKLVLARFSLCQRPQTKGAGCGAVFRAVFD
jgi:hypothetical protein